MSYKVESISWQEFGNTVYDYMETRTIEATGLDYDDAIGYAHYLNDATVDEDGTKFDNGLECGNYKELWSGNTREYRFIISKE